MQPIDLQVDFPSLFVALDYLKEDPYESGWLLGNISGIALVFTTRLVLGTPFDDDSIHRADSCSHAAEYLRVSSTSQEYPEHSKVDVGELVNILQLLHAFHVFASISLQPSFVSVNVGPRQQELISELDNTFDALIYAAVLDHLFHGAEQSAEVLVVNWGWNDAREIVHGHTDTALDSDDPPAQSLSEITQETGVIHSESSLDITSRPPQYEPDDTQIEYVPTGPHVPLHIFCTRYEDLIIPEDPCDVCSENFLESEHDAMVRAKCNARHIFHKDCLDAWINKSAMENANKCPLDREVICEARGRIHMGEQIGDYGGV